MDQGGAALALPGGAGGGAGVRFREGISVCIELDGRALPVSPRYQSEPATKADGTTESPCEIGGPSSSLSPAFEFAVTARSVGGDHGGEPGPDCGRLHAEMPVVPKPDVFEGVACVGSFGQAETVGVDDDGRQRRRGSGERSSPSSIVFERGRPDVVTPSARAYARQADRMAALGAVPVLGCRKPTTVSPCPVIARSRT